MATSAHDVLPAPLKADLSAFDSHPLFMRTLPVEVADEPALSALQSLVYEGTPDEIARNFKERGNEYFKGKRYREAMGFYTQGVDAKPTDAALYEALLINRAACNLELKNYGQVLRDCSVVLTLNQSSQKAYYRSALALLALERLEEAMDCCDRCLKLDGENAAVHALRSRTVAAQEEKLKKLAFEVQRKRDAQATAKAMKLALEKRHIFEVSAASTTSSIAEIPYRPSFADGQFNSMIFPVLLHYPQHQVTEVIAQFHETDTFGDHLKVMFPPKAPPPEWDKKGEYVDDGRLVVYAITILKRLLKIGKKMTLMDVFQVSGGKNPKDTKEREERDGLEISEGCLNFVVLVKGSVEVDWVAEFKKSRDGS